eukprot:231455_1
MEEHVDESEESQAAQELSTNEPNRTDEVANMEEHVDESEESQAAQELSTNEPNITDEVAKMEEHVDGSEESQAAQVLKCDADSVVTTTQKAGWFGGWSNGAILFPTPNVHKNQLYSIT